MKPANEFLSELLKFGINLWVEGDRLRYNSPEGALTPEIRAELTDRKAEIMAVLKQAALNKDAISQTILPISRDRDLPLSFGQQRLWFVSQLDKDSTVYNESLSLKIEGKLQFPILEKVFQEIWRRHEVLRTTFSVVNGSPVQVINFSQNLPLVVMDLQNLGERGQAEEVERLANSQNQYVFNLETGPLLRLTLIKLEPDCHVLLMTIHHIIADGSFMAIFIREFAALYEAFSQGQSTPLPELSIQYADYAYWQRQRLEGGFLAHHLSYWKQQLEGIPPYLDLVTDRLRPPIQTFQGCGEQLQISSALTQKLKQLSQQSGVTLFMTLLAAFTVLLARYTNQQDIVVGSPIANRDRTQLEGLFGFFVNNLTLRIQPQPNLTFSSLLNQVRQVALDAFEHSEAPFEKIVDELQLERNLSYHPLFQVAFVLQNTPMWKLFQNSSDGKLDFSGLTLTLLSPDKFKAKFDLTLEIVELDQKLSGFFIYNADLFAAETIRRMVQHFQILLESVVSNPQQIISQLPLLTRSESDQILVEWNNTQTEYPRDRPIHALFEEQVQNNPNAIAVVYEDQQISYQQLNNKANQLAHYLKNLGVGADVLVGICVERSIDMVVCLLGILKAGGAYVPIDSSYPQERLIYMLEDAHIHTLLTQEHLLPSLKDQASDQPLTVIYVDRDWHNIDLHRLQDNPIISTTGDNLAYVEYTSGSTGKPKGVCIRHRGVVRLVKDTNYIKFHPDLVFLQLAPISFDASTFEIWGSLLNGAKLAIMPPQMPSLEELGQAIQKYRVTTLWLTSGLFNLMVDERLEDLYPLHQLLTGGDVLSVPHVQKVLQKFPNCQLINAYGPTENTTFTCCYSMTELTKFGTSVPIGRPISNTSIYILDGALQPVPIGVSGELYIGGDGLAVGYLNNEQLTAERFIPNPFTSSSTECLYKTGDLARYLPDGNIEFLGRIDFQVKIRGFRIELGEIESLLSQHPQVQETIVIALADQNTNKQLVAYVVPKQEELTSHDLRTFLKQKLPDYMMPAFFVFMDRLPLNLNGKVDRRALPAPDLSSLSLESSFVPPSTPTEQAIAKVWQEILKIEQIGIHDNFFELGGNSLIATQVMSRLPQILALDLPLSLLFELPTIGELSERIDTILEASGDALGSSLTPIHAVSRDQPLPLSFAQQRLWLIDQITAHNAVYNVPLAYRLTGDLDIKIFSQSLNAIAQRHESLRTAFTVVDQQPVQSFVGNLEIDLPIIDLRSLTVNEQKQELSRIAEIEAQAPFDLSQSPLIRAKLIYLAPDQHVFFLTMHHIICDGWSLDIFFRELGLIYEALAAGQPSPLPPLLIQYADFALWQRAWLQGEVLDAQLSYWKQQLRDINPLLQLATDRPRPVVQSYKGDRQTFYLSKSIAEALKALSNSEGVTLFMTLLAAFQTLLHRYTGQADILVGCPIANRNRAEIENLIGFFVNTLALRANFTEHLTFRELLTQTKQVTLEAYAHQDLPFEKLVEELNLERDLRFNPIVQVTFVLQTEPLLALDLSNLKLAHLADYQNNMTKFDLEVSVWETPAGLAVNWGYNSDLFESATMMRMLQHYQTLLEAIASDRHLPIDQISMLTGAEQTQILETWNATATAYPQEKSIAAIFEEQVNLRSNAIAAKFGQTEISYAELNTKANHLAHYLQNKGIGDQELVGICVDQSVEMLIGLLGILKAGAAYVPLDKDYPDDRLKLMLSDAGVRIVITQQQQAARFANHGHEIICLDREWTEISQTPNSLKNPSNQATGNSLAYVIYTSGSTGQPKGVEVPQHAIARLVINTNYINIRIEDRIGQASNASFDAATFEIWGALLNGAMVVGISKETVLTPERLAATILEQQISTLFLTTALFNQIARQKPETFAPLTNLLFGGEAVDVESVRIIMANGKPTRLLHVYGPTENTTFSTWYLINQIAPNAISIPIGHAIANTQTYILDQQQKIVPIGVVGELYVGGDGLARGYLHRPELNAEKFIANSYSPSERLYRTGDLAKYAADGNIEFVGRIDFQVKIRGFRIEIGEVEAAIARQEHVQDVIVIVKDDPLGNKSLIAYVVAKPETALTVSQLRNFLKENLPDYMIPADFVVMDKLPLTANGKVDKKALPSPEDLRSQIADDYVMPQTEAERLIASVWQEILQINNVGIYDNFFEIGGNSLLLVQAYGKLQNLFGSQISMVMLFRYPNIHALAEHLRQNEPTEVSDPNRAENRKSRQDLMKQQRQNRLKSRLPNNPNP